MISNDKSMNYKVVVENKTTLFLKILSSSEFIWRNIFLKNFLSREETFVSIIWV
jgi:hypothetical protein